MLCYLCTTLSVASLLFVGGVAVLQTNLVHLLHSLLSVRNCDLPQDTRDADAVVVLGYALLKSGSHAGQATEPLKARVAAAAQAIKQGQVQHVILSGAHPGDGLRVVTEARAMALHASKLVGFDVQQQQGPSRWVLEEQSTSTRENAMYSLAIAKENSWSTLLLVTNQFHQLRSLWTFQRAAKDLNLQPPPLLYVAAVPFAGHRDIFGVAWLHHVADLYDWGRELLALVWYKYKGYI